MMWCRIWVGVRLKSPWMKMGRSAREGVFLIRVTVSTTSVHEIGVLSRWWMYAQMIMIGVLWLGCLADIAVQELDAEIRSDWILSLTRMQVPRHGRAQSLP